MPDDLAARLNELQRLALRRLEAFGWRVRFVRRPAGEPPTVVVGDPTGRDRAVLTEQGQLDRHIKLKVR
ncbi:MAG: hypothetical protein P8106_04670 [Gammaproteobacteria bacterium]